MRTALIFCDVAGYPNRARILRDVCDATGTAFHYISPADKDIPGATKVGVPTKWLPAFEVCYKPQTWWRCHTLYIAYAQYLKDFDFLWCVEGDVSGAPSTWLRLLQDTADMPQDGLTCRLAHRSENERNQIKWFNHWTTPPEFEWHWHACLCRYSARAVEWLTESAPIYRNVFTEMEPPNVILRNGGTLALMNPPGKEAVYHDCTLKFSPCATPPTLHPRRLRHPIKQDDAF